MISHRPPADPNSPEQEELIAIGKEIVALHDRRMALYEQAAFREMLAQVEHKLWYGENIWKAIEPLQITMNHPVYGVNVRIAELDKDISVEQLGRSSISKRQHARLMASFDRTRALFKRVNALHEANKRMCALIQAALDPHHEIHGSENLPIN